MIDFLGEFLAMSRIEQSLIYGISFFIFGFCYSLFTDQKIVFPNRVIQDLIRMIAYVLFALLVGKIISHFKTK